MRSRSCWSFQNLTSWPLAGHAHADPVVAADLGVTVSIISNGSRITRQWLEEYGPSVDILGISCDSFNESTNRRIGRTDGGRVQHMEHLFRVRRDCEALGIAFKLNTVVTALNKDEDMGPHIAELRPARWKVG